ncbi:RidA family protein [Microbaculum marinisediminis]|uniref:RidA family protein n=1 Tax=Microbaculum marinisediminis TaxID=2931392 RepID=A0AAW5QYW0_9HYPH|nr:RidA family protein [Microbaculum sp. A6E488]MCT8973170.1 RidA family protein [Microbaculum sp. A6E488]
MSDTVESRLAAMGITLPTPPAPAANYVPFVKTGNLVYCSGQVPMGPNGIEHVGKLGDDYSIEQGMAAARLCAINLLAVMKMAVGDLEKVTRCVKLNGYVNCTPDFRDQPKVVNGASDLIAEALGDKGKHARAAVGTSALPLGVAVEVEGIFEVA